MAIHRGAILERIVVFVSSFATVTVLLCGILALAHSYDDRWQEFTAGLTALARETQRLVVGDQTKSPAAVHNFREGVVFAVGYPDDGNLADNIGICPDSSQISWLEEFKKAIVACSKTTDMPLLLNVRGFASIAPVMSEGAESSDEDNLKIAERRGRIIARFLADESENFGRCKSEVDTFCPPCRQTADDDCLAGDGSYIVRYRDWPDYSTMRRFRSMNDGGRPTPRYDVEFFNRTVHIVVMNNACWRPVSWHRVSGRARAAN